MLNNVLAGFIKTRPSRRRAIKTVIVRRLRAINGRSKDL